MTTVLSWLLAQASAENTPPPKTEQLVDWLNSNPVIGWGIAGFAVVAMAVAAVAALTGNLDKIIGFFGKYRPKQGKITDEQLRKLRQQLVEAELGQVIKRLEDSLHHKIRLDLKRKDERQRVGRRDLPAIEDDASPDPFIRRTINSFASPSPPQHLEEDVPTADVLTRPDAYFERLSLIQVVTGLPSVQFDQLCQAMAPPAGIVPGPTAPQGNRASALLEWAQGPTGPGQEKLLTVLRRIVPDDVESHSTDDINGRLLILGEPGSGKTNELLALAKVLLQRAKQAEECPVAVIFELSAWSDDQGKTFSDWLCEQLQDKYSIRPEVSYQWIQKNQLLPLLDGLDELRRVEGVDATSEEIDRKRQAKQIKCIRAINEFLDMYLGTSTVVCCRRKEYEALEAQGETLKRLNGAIYLEELDDEQIQDYLEKRNRKSLWEAIKNQPNLLSLIRSPLFLLMLVVAYQGQAIQSPDDLMDLYIEKQLGDLNNQGAYPPGRAPSPEKTHHYLGWLATKLEQQKVTEFLIERLQPSWLERASDGWLYMLISVMSGLILWLPVWLPLGLASGLLIWMGDIDSKEKFTFSWNRALSGRFTRWGLLLGLVGGLMIGLNRFIRESMEIQVFMLRGGLILLLLSVLEVGLRNGLNTLESELNEKQLPNQGIKRPVKTVLMFGSVGALLFPLMFCLIMWLMFGLVGGLSGLQKLLMLMLLTGMLWRIMLAGVLVGGLAGGLGSIVKHVCLRFVLYHAGVAPWDYEKFLGHAENHRFIQQVGGRYRFVHDLLRKRFAARYRLDNAQ